MPRGWLLLVSVMLATPAWADPSADPIRERLLEALGRDPSIKLRALAAKRLGELAPATADPAVEQALVAALGDDASLVRAMAARALAERHVVTARSTLLRLAHQDADRVVREEAERALARLEPVEPPAPIPAPRRRTVELGRVEFADGESPDPAETESLASSLRDVVETQLEPHLPAIFPREDPGYRLNVRVRRDRVKKERGVEIRCEVSVVVLELPSSHLRHAAQARASGTTATRGARHLSDLEAKVAKEATHVAVREALASLMGH